MGSCRSSELLQTIRHGLIVSCQPRAPLDHPGYVADLARVMVEEGAVALRIEGAERIQAVRSAVDGPIVGIIK
jgi:N-acylglucosamine-6-phosphate 2-epimerase